MLSGKSDKKNLILLSPLFKVNGTREQQAYRNGSITGNID
jgi:hypothetical protein